MKGRLSSKAAYASYASRFALRGSVGGQGLGRVTCQFYESIINIFTFTNVQKV